MPSRRLARLALPLLVTLALLGPSPRAVGVRAADPVTPAAPLNTTRAEHTATALADGRVLVAGGYNGVPTNTALQTLASAELYDPVADRWQAVAPMAAPRQLHTATRLPDGRVLVVGGAGPGQRLLTATATAEIYDPATDRWTATGPLHATRWAHRAVALADGRVMVVGGREQVFDERCGCNYFSLATAEIYDPAAGTWTIARPMGEPRFGHIAVTLADGPVLVAGGRNRDNSQSLHTAELYDPVTDRWQSIATPSGVGFSGTATLLADGEVLLTGDDHALRYNPRTDRWSRTGRMPRGYLILHTATLLPGGAVLVVGGRKDVTAIERYDPITEEWTLVGDLPVTRDHTATLLHDGRVLIAGGKVDLPAAPLAGAWLVADLEPSRCFAETGACAGGRFLEYWSANGGLARNGYPLGPVRDETLEDGKTRRVQYFERVRLEHHPENAAPYDVLLGQFGRRILAGVPGAPTTPASPQPDVTHFPATGHNVGPRFMAYWQAHGELAQFGYPLSEEFTQVLEDGRVYTVQYFERARFEYHPENAPPFDVLLGQFGRRILLEGNVVDRP